MKKLRVESYHDRVFFSEENILASKNHTRCVVGFTYRSEGCDIEFIRADLWFVKLERWIRRMR